MSSRQDEVLLDVDEDFEGFLSDDLVESEHKLKMKSVVNVPKGKESKSKGQRKKTLDKGNLSNFDIMKLSQNDCDELRRKLGIVDTNVFQQSQFDSQSQVAGQSQIDNYSLGNLPNVHVQIDAADISDHEDGPMYKATKQMNMANALFDDEESVEGDSVWELPKLKVPEKGTDISQSLANMINVACTSQCETESLVAKYPVPGNCEKMYAPRVNSEIWTFMQSMHQTSDKSIAQTQNLIASGMTPIIKLAEVLKPQIKGNAEAKTLISDALTLLGQVQYNLSIRRRYMIRPALKKKYSQLCNVSTPISTKLFGDDIGKEIKNCDTTYTLGYPYQYQQNGRGRGGRALKRSSYRGYTPSNQSYNDFENRRYQPYQQRGQYRPPRRSYNQRGYRRPSASATATAPNDQTS